MKKALYASVTRHRIDHLFEIASNLGDDELPTVGDFKLQDTEAGPPDLVAYMVADGLVMFRPVTDKAKIFLKKFVYNEKVQHQWYGAELLVNVDVGEKIVNDSHTYDVRVSYAP